MISGHAPGTDLCEMVELPREVHPWFVGCQFHPEFKSQPLVPQPLFRDFIGAAIRKQYPLLGAQPATHKPKHK